MNIPATLVEKTAKSGNNYFCVELHLTPSCVKRIFLETAEIELLRLVHGGKGVKLNTTQPQQ